MTDSLLPTPVVHDASERRTLDDWALGQRTGAPGLPTIIDDLFPTPRATDGTKGGPNQRGTSGDLMLPSVAAQELRHTNWGKYQPAIRRWEHVNGPVPSPTAPGQGGKPRLAPAFSEWLMGLPPGHVTGVPGLSRNAQLTAIGNGVVPQQAAHALRLLLPAMIAATGEHP